MVDIFDEVNEDLQRERAERLWKKYGPYLLGLAALIVVGVAGREFWMQYQADRRISAGDRFAAAVELIGSDDAEAAAMLNGIAAADTSGYGVLARLRTAPLLRDRGDPDGALNVYDDLIATAGIAPVYRDLARVLAGALELDTDPAAAAARVEMLAVDNNPLRFSAREILGLAAMARNETDTARALFERIADDTEAPQDMRGRAARMLTLLGSEGT